MARGADRQILARPIVAAFRRHLKAAEVGVDARARRDPLFLLIKVCPRGLIVQPSGAAKLCLSPVPTFVRLDGVRPVVRPISEFALLFSVGVSVKAYARFFADRIVFADRRILARALIRPTKVSHRPAVSRQRCSARRRALARRAFGALRALLGFECEQPISGSHAMLLPRTRRNMRLTIIDSGS